MVINVRNTKTVTAVERKGISRKLDMEILKATDPKINL
jgi:hypothetical protein